MARWSITGTTISAVQRWSRTVRSIASGSKRRVRTSVEDRLIPSVKCAKPQEWNIGAAMCVLSRARSGILARSAAAGSSDSGCLREAPFGVPVVPEVRMMTRPFSAGGRSSDVSPSAMSVSSVGSPAAFVSLQATMPFRPSRAPAQRPANSSS
jgi:hypothetical protein